MDRIAVLTFDTDWAGAQVVDAAMDEVLVRNLPATFFVTGEYPQLMTSAAGLELAPHTNPASLAEVDLVAELQQKSAFCPVPPVGQRSHSLYWTERLRPIFRKNGIKYDSSTMMYLEADIRPFWNGYDLLELPIFFMDFFHLEFCQLARQDAFDVQRLGLERGGLKVFDFHPVHLYLNTPSLGYYTATKNWYHHPDELKKRRHMGYGTHNLFEDILDELYRLDYQFYSLSDINSSLRQDWASAVPVAGEETLYSVRR